MKKIIAIILACAMAFSLVGCTSAPVEDNQPTPTVEATPTPEVEPEGEPDVVEPEATPEVEEKPIATQSDEESGDHSELPAVVGNDEFAAAFTGNEIDTYYENEIGNATSATYIVNATEMTSFYWNSAMNSSFETLLSLLDEEEYQAISDEQIAWANDVNLVIEEITNAAGDDEFTSVKIAYETMLLYRGRSIEILSNIYNRTGEVDITLANTEAAG